MRLGVPGATRLAVVALLLLTIVSAAPSLGSLAAQTSAGDDHAVEAAIRSRIEQAISPDTGRGAIRLPAVWVDEGRLSVVFALREQDDLDGFRAAAEEDVFQILRAVYTADDSPVVDTTVVGTYSVTGARGARELRVLRAALSAAGARQIDWDSAEPADLFTAAEVYRMYPPFGDEQGNPVAPALAPADQQDRVISSPVNIGGRLLFLRCIGSGSPTVILEAGYGDNGTIWAPVQIHASEFVRVCSYDRAGLERSDPPERYPRTGADVVADLHAALTESGVAPPYLLVGHSYGALFSRLFAETYPDEVAGLLLLDPWPETYDDQLRALVTSDQWTAYERMLAADPDNEVVNFIATYDELRAGGPLPDVPLLILSHGQPATADCCPPGWPVAAQERLWQASQEAMARLTPKGEERIVPGSGHMIHQAKPDVVVAAIHELVEKVRAQP
jgi:pimeloyl-ACP methyl ester carboxylesterase